MSADRLEQLEAENAELRRRLTALQTILDSRPAINAALPASYITWSQGICQLDMLARRGLDS